MIRRFGFSFEAFLHITRSSYTLCGFGAAAVALGFCALAGCGGSDEATLPAPSPSPSFAPITTNRTHLTYTGAEGTEADLTPVDTSNFSCTLTPVGLALAVQGANNRFVLNVTYPHGAPAPGDYPLTSISEEDTKRANVSYYRSSATMPGEGNRAFYPPDTPSGSIEILSVSDHHVRLRVKDVVLRNELRSGDTIVASGEVEFDQANAKPSPVAFMTGKSQVAFDNVTGVNADTRPMAYGIRRPGDASGTDFGYPDQGFTAYTNDDQGNRRELEVSLYNAGVLVIGVYSQDISTPGAPYTYARVSYSEQNINSDPYGRNIRRWSSRYSPVPSGTVEVLEAGQERFRVRLKGVLLTGENSGTGTMTVSGEAERYLVQRYVEDPSL